MEKMTHDYIRQIIPAEISERGGALLRLVGGKTVPLETSIKEAKQAGYVLGDEELVKRQFEGLVKCMRDETEADGMARQIGGWVTVHPVFFGPIDLARGFDPEKNGARIRMRLLKRDRRGQHPCPRRFLQGFTEKRSLSASQKKRAVRFRRRGPPSALQFLFSCSQAGGPDFFPLLKR